MKIKKFVVLAICPVVLTLLLSPVSFADVSPSPVVSPLTEPEPYLKVVGDHLEVSVFYVVNRPNDENLLYNLTASYPLGTTVKFMFTFPSGNTSNQRVRLWSDREALLLSDSSRYRGHSDTYDILSGNYLSGDVIASVSEAGGYTLSFRSGYFPRTTGIYDSVNDFNYGYPIYPSNMQVYAGSFPDVLNVSPYVSWSLKPPEHNVFHSHLSEPEWDKYNRYFVLDDKLFWVSIRLNGFYVKESDLEGSTGYYQYEAIVPAQGGYENGYSGSLAQYSGYIPVNLSSSVFFDDLPFSLSLVADTENWAIRIQANPVFDGIQTKVDYDLYVSEFNLEDGSYISSSFSHETQDLLDTAQYALSEPGVFSSVHCYGIDFYNFKNLPINLSDVQWGFDLEFVLWREDVLQKLSDIYDLLSEAESVTSYQAPDLASKMDDENIINDLSYNSGDVQQDLNDNIDRGIQALGSDGGVLQSLSSQIIGLGNGKIFSLLIISLSLGILILILGKNKND